MTNPSYPQPFHNVNAHPNAPLVFPNPNQRTVSNVISSHHPSAYSSAYPGILTTSHQPPQQRPVQQIQPNHRVVNYVSHPSQPYHPPPPPVTQPAPYSHHSSQPPHFYSNPVNRLTTTTSSNSNSITNHPSQTPGGTTFQSPPFQALSNNDHSQGQARNSYGGGYGRVSSQPNSVPLHPQVIPQQPRQQQYSQPYPQQGGNYAGTNSKKRPLDDSTNQGYDGLGGSELKRRAYNDRVQDSSTPHVYQHSSSYGSGTGVTGLYGNLGTHPGQGMSTMSGRTTNYPNPSGYGSNVLQPSLAPYSQPQLPPINTLYTNPGYGSGTSGTGGNGGYPQTPRPVTTSYGNTGTGGYPPQMPPPFTYQQPQNGGPQLPSYTTSTSTNTYHPNGGNPSNGNNGNTGNTGNYGSSGSSGTGGYPNGGSSMKFKQIFSEITTKKQDTDSQKDSHSGNQAQNLVEEEAVQEEMVMS